MTQQAPFDYYPLLLGLGYIQPKKHMVGTMCPKIFTTRTHRLSAEYHVVEGDRYHAEPVIIDGHKIEFQVKRNWELDLKTAQYKNHGDWWDLGGLSEPETGLTFPERDLGICSTTFEQLKAELLKLNRKATQDTKFYINEMERI